MVNPIDKNEPLHIKAKRVLEKIVFALKNSDHKRKTKAEG